MYLEIVTPEASLVSGEVTSVTVPGVDGEFQMLNNHAAIVSLLGKGKVKFAGNPSIAENFKSKFTQENGKWVLEINSGTVQMAHNKVIVLAD
ncbi:MAG TPA: F0F1 ATP synthase subunit epsilon [Flavobacteriaceae bacterium]|nr:F0F1 ATP synthase subunit epsilon [Flavobacteriaceae bacterium]MCB9212644.1 F0F1 ATP synthase subunit epsilon [Alteromonas sp.]HPF11495.1 F0F1 ATP synthase subunit epsilon [Flavobacteriaceae bacterium]HQU21028.1 F0F1 ATP synthase subunit epsilon [Flavobacteriaceae bacterium]HQU65929.1 F0F1 ATP synthase subunit epsilon [Flavobacteriaceae bacterium]